MSTPRPVHLHTTEAAAQAIAAFHPDVVHRVAEQVQTHDVVVVGMATNVFVGRARTALTQAGVAFEYLEIGGYLSQWKERLAVKMWSGWPTFPQVFVKGRLIGGCAETQAALANGDLQRWLEQPRA